MLVHQHKIKLANFRSGETSNIIRGVIPYIDPKGLVKQQPYSLNKKSDVYSIGVLLWEISSGIPPFYEVDYDFSLMYKISQGRREAVIPDTPKDYAKLYTGNYDSIYCLFYLLSLFN